MRNHRIDSHRLMRRVHKLGKIGAVEGAGVCRLALADEDKAGRDLVVSGMRKLGLEVTIDRIGNIACRRRIKAGADILLQEKRSASEALVT